MKKIILICAVYSLLSTGLAIETGAEVRVRTRPDGEYETTTIIPGGPPQCAVASMEVPQLLFRRSQWKHHTPAGQKGNQEQ